MDFGSWVRVPPWWVGVGVTARGGKVPGQALFPQLAFPLEPKGPIKTRRGPFLLGVCVCVRACVRACVCVCGTSLLGSIV